MHDFTQGTNPHSSTNVTWSIIWSLKWSKLRYGSLAFFFFSYVLILLTFSLSPNSNIDQIGLRVLTPFFDIRFFVSLLFFYLNAVNRIFSRIQRKFETVMFEFKFGANKRLNKFHKRYILPEFMILFVINECLDPTKKRKTLHQSFVSYGRITKREKKDKLAWMVVFCLVGCKSEFSHKNSSEINLIKFKACLFSIYIYGKFILSRTEKYKSNENR